MEYSFAPLIEDSSKILILGSLPGVRSLEEQQYYAHPMNKFWGIMYSEYTETFSCDYERRCRLLADNGVALWDVIRCAERTGSLDGNIRMGEPNDIPKLLATHPNIGRILFNGGCAFSTYKKYFGQPKVSFVQLLSTSPACAGRDRERLAMWRDALTR